MFSELLRKTEMEIIKGVAGVWVFRLGMTALGLGLIAYVAIEYFGVHPGVVVLGSWMLSSCVLLKLPLGVEGEERAGYAVLQAVLLLLVTCGPPGWAIMSFDKAEREEFVTWIPGVREPRPMLSPEGEIVEGHKYSSVGDAIVEFTAKPLGLWLVFGPFLLFGFFVIKQLMIVLVGEDSLKFVSGLFMVAYTPCMLCFIFLVTGYATKKVDVSEASLIVTGLTSAVLYALHWLFDPETPRPPR